MSADLGWLAGIIDGEGTVYFGVNKGFPRPSVAFASTSHPILIKADLVLDTHRVRHARTLTNGTNKPCYRTEVWGRSAIDLLVLLDGMIVRHAERARAMVEFFAGRYEVPTTRGGERRNVTWNEGDLARWEALRLTFHRNFE